MPPNDALPNLERREIILSMEQLFGINRFLKNLESNEKKMILSKNHVDDLMPDGNKEMER